MKFELEQATTKYRFTAYGDNYVSVNNVAYKTSLVVMPKNLVTDWNVASFDQLSEKSFEYLLSFKPEILLLGTGDQLRFPHPGLYQVLMKANVGLEVMDTRAACRTYNILMAEGRHVVVALLVG